MNRIKIWIDAFDYVLDSKRRRHITGGVLLSASMLFSGLAITVMTFKPEEDDHE